MTKSVLTILATSLVSLTSLIANADTVLDECQITCSVRCKQYAKDVKIQADNILKDCGANSDKAEVVEACKNVGFPSYEQISVCINSGRTAEAVRECRALGFSTYQQINQCIANIGRKDVGILKACRSVNFSTYDQINRCIANANNADVVQACAKVGFGTYEQILACIPENSFRNK